MDWIQNLLIIAGTSFDVFAAMECQGSLVRKVNKKQLAVICGIASILQFAAMFTGYVLSYEYCKKNPMENETLLGEILSTAILVYLGVSLMIKAAKNERVDEHLVTTFDIHWYLRLGLMTSLYTLLAGIAFGFLQTQLSAILVMVVCFTIVSMIAGMYTGYHFGFEQKTKAYVVGAVLLWIAGLEVLVRCVLQII